MKKLFYLLLTVFLLFFISCNNSTNPDFDLSNFHGITETNENGQIIGNIDKNDWSSSSYENIYFGTSFWLSPTYNYIFYTDSILDSLEQPVSIFNASNQNINITSTINYPFTSKPSQLTAAPGIFEQFKIKYIQPDSVLTKYQDELIINSSTGDQLIIQVSGELNPGNVVSTVPVQTGFYPAYPNPCRGKSYLRFSTSTSSKVKLKIVNQKGKEIEEIVNKQLDKGIYEYEWNINGAGSDIYRAFIEIGNMKSHGDIQVLEN